MRNHRRAAALLLLLVLGTAACLGCHTIRVATDFDPNVDFSRVRTYAWLPEPPGHAGDPRLHDPLVDARVRRAVNRELAARGYRLASPRGADVHVTYYLGLETRVSWRMVSHGFHYQGGWLDHHRTETTLREYERGTLLIDLLDPAHRSLIWRGSAVARLRRESDPERREQQVRDAVQRILELFPPP